MDQVQRTVEPFQPKSELYPLNEVITSRYNVVSFLPKCLFEQFRRLANVYFVVIGIIACIGYYGGYYASAVEPAAVLAPVSIVVMISVVKEGVEDIKRHQGDAKVNARPVSVVGVEGAVTLTQWKELQVGSIVLLRNDEEIPADIIVLASGGVQGSTSYVETAAIDGETNLKIRMPALAKDVSSYAAQEEAKASNNPMLAAGSPSSSASAASSASASGYEESIEVSPDMTRVSGIVPLKLSLNAEAPNSSIHHFDGSIEFTDATGVHHHATLSEKNLLLRGAVVRATTWCVGMVVYTGKQTKLSLNSRAPPSKLSAVDRVVNRALAVAIGCMILVCFISMFLSVAWQQRNYNADYLCLNKDDLTPPYSSASGGGCTSSAPSSILTIFTFATLFNNFVCISMYVSLEMIYLAQAYFIQNDLNMYDAETDSPAECHTSGMCADIGQVQYVLSDKTGTLTKNLMTLRRCSIAGVVYGAPLEPPTVSVTEEDYVEEDPEKGSSSSSSSNSTAVRSAAASASASVAAEKKKAGDAGKLPAFFRLEDMALHRHSHPVDAQNAEILCECMWNLAVCNTVMLMPDATTGKLNITDSKSLQKCLNAESPDEVALVMAAAEFGQELLIHSDITETRVRSFGKAASAPVDNSFKILAINEFESNRKRMSVLVRQPNKPPVLYCKGADTSMLPFCKDSAQTAACLQHIGEFAVTGLRTLVMSRKILSEEEATRWLATYKVASNNIGRRTEMLSACAIDIEKDMELLGAVGIEDELQDGVSNAIQMLQRAGLNVWMITGDKPETAIAISQMCCLLRAEHQIQSIVGLSGQALIDKVADVKRIADREAEREALKCTTSGDERVQSPVVLWWERSVLSKYWATFNQQYLSKLMGGAAERQRAGKGRSSSGGSVQEAPVPGKQRSRRASIGGIETGQQALIVDGTSLEGIWQDEATKNAFTDAVRVFPTVVACRVSPLQKASLVRMVKTGAGQPITLAIGDGANDVGMIQEARVGVGISGREGRHAANSADFAIGQFQFLVPLLLHHGRFNYIRCSNLVLYSFFKNLVLVSMLFYYCFYSGFSGTVYVDSFVLSGYNFYLGLPIIALGALDFDVSKQEVMAHPKLAYNTGRLGELLNNWNMLRWCTSAFLYGMLIYTVCIRYFSGPLSYTDGDQNDSGVLYMLGLGFNNQNGQDGGIYTEGFLMFSVLVWSMQYKIVMMTHCMTYINWAVWWLSFFGYFLFCWVYGLVPNLDDNDWYHVVNFTFPQPQYWLAVFSIPILFVIVDLLFERSLAYLFPTSQDFLQQKIASDHEAAKKKVVK